MGKEVQEAFPRRAGRGRCPRPAPSGAVRLLATGTLRPAPPAPPPSSGSAQPSPARGSLCSPASANPIRIILLSRSQRVSVPPQLWGLVPFTLPATPWGSLRPSALEPGPESEQMPPGVILPSSLIATRNRPQLLDPQNPASRSTELLPSSTIRLDHQNISAIGRLPSLQEVHSLYLQQNQIEKIENLDCFPNLRSLSLAGNRICRVENLQPLRHLRLLDLSHNQIQTLDPGELPCSLRLLDLTGNECTQQHGYRKMVVGALPHLLELDTQPVRGVVGEEEEGGSSSSEDEDDELLLSKPSSPFTAGKDFFVDLHQDLSRHSQQRQSEALEKHQRHLEELEELPQPPLRSANSSGASRGWRLQEPQAGLEMLVEEFPTTQIHGGR
ncbi:leucine-rich repeat-containing protein 46 [Indicator indicator]|uniref:leucine-rich repeat-containing protein 46 n=1 Tax=Indicator indicator TaxID=1002788 RepID=UPI0023DF35A0|nr:leucine-rich repeat-containing protein 46 [Indicator indicator]